METHLHRDLKLRYAQDAAQTEVVVGAFRIDAIAAGGELVEIQHASLAALRPKVKQLLSAGSRHRLRIVKPIIARKWIVTLDANTGEPIRRRLSPKRCAAMDVFHDLVHFVHIFPLSRLTLDVLLVDVEELRVPKLKHRFRRKNYTTAEQRLVSVAECVTLRTASDLFQLLPELDLPKKFDTAALAAQIGRPRWFAQKVAYCLKHTGAVREAGKCGNSHLYSRVAKRRAA